MKVVTDSASKKFREAQLGDVVIGDEIHPIPWLKIDGKDGDNAASLLSGSLRRFAPDDPVVIYQHSKAILGRSMT